LDNLLKNNEFSAICANCLLKAESQHYNSLLVKNMQLAGFQHFKIVLGLRRQLRVQYSAMYHLKDILYNYESFE
jgi:hypothetical protein